MTRLLLAALLLCGGCVKYDVMPEVDLSELDPHPSIAVGPVHGDDPAVDVSVPFARALAETGLFTQVEHVPSPVAADQVLIGTVHSSCSMEKSWPGSHQTAWGVLNGLVLPVFLFTAPAMGGMFRGQLCHVQADIVLSRGGRRWRRYRESGNVVLPDDFDWSAVYERVVRRIGARVVADLEGRSG